MASIASAGSAIGLRCRCDPPREAALWWLRTEFLFEGVSSACGEWVVPEMSQIKLYDGSTLTGVHEPDECALEHCCIHNPSDHPLKDAPLLWMGELRAMYRVCEHEFFHPDPDDLQFMLASWRMADAEAIASVHMMSEHCDGCCQ